MQRVFLLSVFLSMVLFASPNLAITQDVAADATPDEQAKPQNVLGGLFGDAMQAHLTEIATKMIDGYLDYLAKPQTVKKLATFQKNYFDALVDQGFTKEQAFELVLRFGNPLAYGPQGGK